jgi:hypothetical protein
MRDEELTARQRLQAYGAETDELGDREEKSCSVCQYVYNNAVLLVVLVYAFVCVCVCVCSEWRS